MVISRLPVASAAHCCESGTSMNWTVVNPSACSSSSATYWGAMQMPGIFRRRMFVVSGGASWAEEFTDPKRAATPVDDNVLRKRRRFGVDRMTSLPCLSFLSKGYHTTATAGGAALRDFHLVQATLLKLNTDGCRCGGCRNHASSPWYVWRAAP